MATVITAGNATNGLSLTADNTGAFEFKTGTGAGTTAITVDSSQNVTFAGNLTATGTITGTGGVTGGLGTGQTWQSFTIGTTRISGTTYTNTTNKPIAVAIVAQVSVALSMTIDGVSLTGNATNSGTNRSWTLYIVPPNQTYVTSGTLLNWYELR